MRRSKPEDRTCIPKERKKKRDFVRFFFPSRHQKFLQLSAQLELMRLGEFQNEDRPITKIFFS